MSDDATKSISVTHNGLKFGFYRDYQGNGHWTYMSKGRSDYGYGMGCIVPRQYWSEIRCSALNQGIDPSIIDYYPAVKLSNTRSTSRSSTKLFTSKRTSSPRQTKQKDDGGIKIFV